MRTILRAISLRMALDHKFRTFLTVIGIALGVAAYIGVTILSSTITDSFTRMIDLITGKVNLQITGGPTGVEESVLDRVKAIPEVKAAVPTIQTYSKTQDGQALMILAVDTLNDHLVRDYKMEDAQGLEISDPLLFLNSRNSILLTKEYARKNGIKIDTTLQLMTSQGKREFIVRGLLVSKGPAEAFGSRFALMDVYSGQLFFNREGKFDTIDVLLREGIDTEVAKASISKALSGQYDVQRPTQKTEGVENMMWSFRIGLSILSIIVVIMGTFIIFNTVYTAVFQRKREIGIMRMVGVTRTGVIGMFCLEGTILGAIGSVIGVGGGFLLGHYLVVNYAETVSSIYVLVDTSHTSFRWSTAIIGFLLGTGVAFIGSLYPAWRASMVTPLEVLRYGIGLVYGKGAALWRYGGALIVSLCCVAIGLVWPGLKDQLNGVRMAIIAILFTAIALTPFFIRYLLQLIGRAGFRNIDSLRRMAAENVLRDLGRSAMTVSPFMLALAVMLDIYIFSNSMRTEIKIWMDEAINADMVVTSSSALANRSAIPVDISLADQIRRIPNVDWVTPVRMLLADYNNTRIVVLARDWTHHITKGRFRFTKTYVPDPVKDLIEDKGVVLSQNMVVRNPLLQNAQTIHMATPKGYVDFPILAISNEYTSETGTVIFSDTNYKKFFEDTLADMFMIFLTPGANMSDIRKQIYDLMGSDFNLFVLTNREMKQEILKALDQMFNLAVSLEVMAMIIGFIAIVNNLLTTVMDRTREIGVLRAVGATKGQVGRIFVIQAGFLGLSGALLSIGAGFSIAAIHVMRLTRIYGGWTMPMHYSVEHIFITVASAVLVGLAAGFLPARRAAGLVVHQALKYE